MNPMQSRRNFMGYGYQTQGYPTGRNPLALDLATPTFALTQQMIKRKGEKIAEDKQTMDSNLNTIMSALDFENVKGIGQNVRRQHMKNIDELKNKWVEAYIESEGKLSANDKLNLQFDKELVETDLQKMRSEVETYAKAQKMLIDDWNIGQADITKKIFDTEKSAANLSKLKDNIGQGNVDAMSALVGRYVPIDEGIQQYFGENLDLLMKEAVYRDVDTARPDGGIDWDKGIMYLKNGSQVPIETWENQFIDQYVDDERLSRWTPEQRREGMQRAVDLRKWMGKDVDTFSPKRTWDPRRPGAGPTEQTKHMINLPLHGLLIRDQQILSDLSVKGGFEFKYDEDSNELRIYKAGKQIDQQKYPAPNASNEMILNFKRFALQYFPSKLLQGLDVNDISSLIIPEYGSYTDEASTFVPERGIRWQSSISGEPFEKLFNSNNFYKKDVSELSGKQNRERAEIAHGMLQSSLPDNYDIHPVKKKGWTKWSDPKYTGAFEIEQPDGTKMYFDITTKQGTEKFKAYLDNVNKWELTEEQQRSYGHGTWAETHEMLGYAAGEGQYLQNIVGDKYRSRKFSRAGIGIQKTTDPNEAGIQITIGDVVYDMPISLQDFAKRYGALTAEQLKEKLKAAQ